MIEARYSLHSLPEKPDTRAGGNNPDFSVTILPDTGKFTLETTPDTKPDTITFTGSPGAFRLESAQDTEHVPAASDGALWAAKTSRAFLDIDPTTEDVWENHVRSWTRLTGMQIPTQDVEGKQIIGIKERREEMLKRTVASFLKCFGYTTRRVDGVSGTYILPYTRTVLDSANYPATIQSKLRAPNQQIDVKTLAAGIPVFEGAHLLPVLINEADALISSAVARKQNLAEYPRISLYTRYPKYAPGRLRRIARDIVRPRRKKTV